MNRSISRREAMTESVAATGALMLAGQSGLLASEAETSAPESSATEQAALAKAAKKVRYCLNTSTIRGQKLTILEEVDLAAAAGYQAIEPWMGELQAYTEQGGRLADLKKRIEDQGLTVDSAIGFASWIVDDDGQRAAGVEALRRDMETLRQIGGTRIAAPPVGATDQANLNLQKAAERYAAILELGRQTGVTPALELWGFSKSLSRVGELMHVAVESADRDACLLLDVYHIFKGGSDFGTLRLVPGSCVPVLHMNDYPGDIPRDTIGDKDRVYPGDGVAPVPAILRQLLSTGFAGTLSLELFNPGYWEQPAADVLRTGLDKMKAALAAI
jgi:2-keto-myo-inositol isomerase